MDVNRPSHGDVLQLMQQQHSKQLESSLHTITQLRAFTAEYQRLQHTLHQLPASTRHQSLIPIGAGAFMPGSLVHTNEVLVLLGDNWFVERTASQARDIAGRRLQECRDQLKSAETAAEISRHWVERATTEATDPLTDPATDPSTGAVSGGVDIKEHCTDEEYQLERQRHRSMVKKHKLKQIQERETLQQQQQQLLLKQGHKRNSKQERENKDHQQNLKREEENIETRRLEGQQNSKQTSIKPKENKKSKDIESSVDSSPKIRAMRVTSSKDEEGGTAHQDLMKRLDQLMVQEDDEDSDDSQQGLDNENLQDKETLSDLESLTDNLSEESDDDSSDSEESDNESDESDEVKDDEKDDEEDSEDDYLPANLNKFKNVKIESPMPSGTSDRKFLYNDKVKFKTPTKYDSTTVIGESSDGGDASPSSYEESKDVVSDVTPIVRGRTRSFNRTENHKMATTSGGNCGARSFSTDDEKDLGDDGGTLCGNPGKVPIARRVSWADQSLSSMDDCTNTVRIRYMATAASECENIIDNALESKVSKSMEVRSLKYQQTKSTVGEADESESAGATNITCIQSPADLVKLAGGNICDKSETGVQIPTTTIITTTTTTTTSIIPKSIPTSTTSTIPTTTSTIPTTTSTILTTTSTIPASACADSSPAEVLTPGLPKKSILKQNSSQEMTTETAGAPHWLDGPDSVPITNVYTHEPPLSPHQGGELEEPVVVPAFTYRVVAHGQDGGGDVTRRAEAAGCDVSVTSPPAAAAPPEPAEKKMSKFKASRLKQQQQERQ